MKNRLEKLRNEVMPECREDVSYISSKDILNKVDEKLNAVPSERRIYMKQKVLKGFAIACIVTAAMASSVFAMTNIDMLKHFFSGDTEVLEDYVSSPENYVSDGNFKIGLEQIITTKYSAKAIISVTALSDEGRRMLKDEELNVIGDTYVNYVDDSPEGHYINGMGGRELTEYKTADRSLWEISIEALNTISDGEKVAMEFEFLDTKDNVIIFELNTDVETAEYVLPGQPYGSAKLKLNPMGAIIERGIPAGEEFELYDTSTYFIMADGSVKTFNQLFDVSMASIMEEGGKYDMWECFADAREILDMSEFKKVIVDGIEYDLNNVNSYKKADESSLLKPFECEIMYKNDLYYFPLDEFLEGMGAKANEKVFVYCKDSYEITDDGSMIKNGSEKYENTIDEIDGRKCIIAKSIDELFGMKNYVKNSEAPIDERIMVIVP